MINLVDIKRNIFVKEGQKIDLKKYRILGMGEGFKAEILAKGATASAIEKMEKAGGKIIVEEKKEIETPLMDIKELKKGE
jgi:ribosomal protein L15